MLADSIKK